ncbi:uncharacterized protein G2W53_039218 [Senna tora]|uniref:Uncharacterized protein n=1 Tax=Senna tora TaxID=362788 RepID=A0A834SNC1_9FABA|nr:uncharacterized protein G2W53_039218 [Senna tora]
MTKIQMSQLRYGGGSFAHIYPKHFFFAT